MPLQASQPSAAQAWLLTAFSGGLALGASGEETTAAAEWSLRLHYVAKMSLAMGLLLTGLVELPRTFQGLHSGRNRPPVLQVLSLPLELLPAGPVRICGNVPRQVTDGAPILRVRFQPCGEAVRLSHPYILSPPCQRCEFFRGGRGATPLAHGF